jgi:hypothetical protein
MSDSVFDILLEALLGGLWCGGMLLLIAGVIALFCVGVLIALSPLIWFLVWTHR